MPRQYLQVNAGAVVGQLGERGVAPQAFWGPVDDDRVPTFLSGVGTATVTLAASAGAPVTVAFADGIGEGGPRLIVKRLTANLTLTGLSAGMTQQLALQYDPVTEAVSLVAMPLLWEPASEENPPASGETVATAPHTAATSATGTAGSSCASWDLRQPWLSFRGNNNLFGALYSPAANTNFWLARPVSGVFDLLYTFNMPTTLSGFAFGVPTSNASTTGTSLRTFPQYYPSAIAIQAKANSGDEWTTVKSWYGQSIYSGGTPGLQSPFGYVTYVLNGPATYRYWRIVVSGPQTLDGSMLFADVKLLAPPYAPVRDLYQRETNSLLSSTGEQVYRVYIGSATCNVDGTLTAVTPYACGTRYLSPWIALNAAGMVAWSHNLGVRPTRVQIFVRAMGYAYDRLLQESVAFDGTNRYGVRIDYLTATDISLAAGQNGLWGNGAGQLLTSGLVRVLLERGW